MSFCNKGWDDFHISDIFQSKTNGFCYLSSLKALKCVAHWVNVIRSLTPTQRSYILKRLVQHIPTAELLQPENEWLPLVQVWGWDQGFLQWCDERTRTRPTTDLTRMFSSFIRLPWRATSCSGSWRLLEPNISICLRADLINYCWFNVWFQISVVLMKPVKPFATFIFALFGFSFSEK